MTRVSPALLFWALLPLACTEAELPTGHVVVRDAHGAITRELRATATGFVRKPDGTRIRISGKSIDAGEVKAEGDRLVVRGTSRAELARSPGHVELYDPVRAPLGQLTDRDGKTWAYDPGGSPRGSARADGDRVILTDRDGNAKGFVSGLPPSAAAALLLSGGLSDLERDVLALSLAR